MVAIKIVLTILGVCTACSKSAPSQTLINKIELVKRLTPSQDIQDVRVVRSAVDGEQTIQKHAIASRRPQRGVISKILKGMVLKEQLSTKNIGVHDRSSFGSDSETSAVQVSPDKHSDYIHIENYIPTFVTLPCNLRSCDYQSSNINCQIVSDILHSNVPSSKSIHCPQLAVSHDAVIGSNVIPEAVASIPLNPSGSNIFATNNNEGFASISSAHGSDSSSSNTEYSDTLQSEIVTLPFIESDHIISSPNSPPPLSHHDHEFDEAYNIVNQAMQADLHDSYNHKLEEHYSDPQYFFIPNDDTISSGIDTSPPGSAIFIPYPPAYFPLHPPKTEAAGQNESKDIISPVVSITESYESTNTVTIPEDGSTVFESKAVIVIPEAPALMPLNPPNTSYYHSFSENTKTDSDYAQLHLDIETKSKEIVECNTYSPKVVLPESENPVEIIDLIPEPPIYFPFNPPKTSAFEQDETSEISTISNNHEFSNTDVISENTHSWADLPIIVIPEAPALLPLNQINITSTDSTTSNTANTEFVQAVHSDYSEITDSETDSHSEEILDNTHVIIPPAPALMPLDPPNITHHYLLDTQHSNEKNSIHCCEDSNVHLLDTPFHNPTSNQKHTIDHAHLVTTINSETHFYNAPNDIHSLDATTSSSYFDSSSLAIEPIVIPEAPSLIPVNPVSLSNTFTDSNSIFNHEHVDEVVYEDNERENFHLIEIPEAPMLMPLNSTYTGSSYNLVTTAIHSIHNEDNNDKVDLDIHAVETVPSYISTLEDEPYIYHETSSLPAFENPTPENILDEELIVSKDTPLNILLSTNQKIILPHVLQNSNILVVSHSRNEIHGQEDEIISSLPEYASLEHVDSEPIAIESGSNIVVSSVEPIGIEKTKEIVTQLDTAINKLKIYDDTKQNLRNLKGLPPCESEGSVDAVIINVFEAKKCKQDTVDSKINSSSKLATSKHTRRRKVVRTRKSKLRNQSTN